MSIVLKHILKNIKEKKLRSLLIIISLTLSVIVLTICLTLKDNILEKYTEFLLKSVGTTDVILSKETPFEIEKIENLSDNYSIASIVHYIKDKNDVIGMNIVDLQKNKMIKSDRSTNLANNEVIISRKLSDSKNIKINDTIKVLDYELKVVEIVENYGIFVEEIEEQPTYLVSIETANKIMYENSDEYEKAILDENKTYIMGAYIDILDDDIESAKEDLKQKDKEFSVVTVKANLEDALNQINSLMIIMLVITTLIAFYIINSILKLVLEERIAVIGTFRSIGASSRMTNCLLYLENITYAIISSGIGITIANILINPITNTFISAGDIELKNTAGIKPIYILIVVLFTIFIQISITFWELRKTKHKEIREIIFDTQDTKYKMKLKNIIIGLMFIVLSSIIYIKNNKFDFIMGLLPVVFVIIGFVMVLPLLIKIFSKILSVLLKNRKTSFLASKNVADNKIVVSSTTLLFIIIAMTSMIYNIAQTISNTYDGFDRVTH